MRRITADGNVETVARSGWPWAPSGLVISGAEVFVLERMGTYWGFPLLEMAVSKFVDHPRVFVWVSRKAAGDEIKRAIQQRAVAVGGADSRSGTAPNHAEP